MVAPRRKRTPKWHAIFSAMLPRIRRCASVAFRGFKPEAREDAITEVIANAVRGFYGLVKKGQGRTGLPHGARRLRNPASPRSSAGRQQAEHSRRAQRILPEAEAREGRAARSVRPGRERVDGDVVEDRRAGPAETAAARIDIGEWFRDAHRKRKIAQALAVGERTIDVAKRFRLEPWQDQPIAARTVQGLAAFSGRRGVAGTVSQRWSMPNRRPSLSKER